MTSSKHLTSGIAALTLAVLIGGQVYAKTVSVHVAPEAIKQTTTNADGTVTTKKKKKKKRFTSQDHGGSFKM